MKLSEQLKKLVDQMPAPGPRGTYAGIDKEKVEKAIPEIHKGGRDSILGLVEMLVEPGEGDDIKDIKPHSALHFLAVYVSGLADDKPRREFAETLASQIGGKLPKGVQKYLIQELQVVGHKASVAALGKALLDQQLCEPAARALITIGQGAAEQFRKALPQVNETCRLTIVQNLGVVGDVGSIDTLKKATRDKNRDIRVAAAWGLAKLGDAGSVDLLLKAADGEGWERIQATDACFQLADKLTATGKKSEAKKIYSHLQKTRSDLSERYVRDAANRALAEVK